MFKPMTTHIHPEGGDWRWRRSYDQAGDQVRAEAVPPKSMIRKAPAGPHYVDRLSDQNRARAAAATRKHRRHRRYVGAALILTAVSLLTLSGFVPVQQTETDLIQK